MIRQVSGTVLSAGTDHVVIEVAGLGLHAYTPAPGALAPGAAATLFTHLAIKQDGLDLYGFREAADRDFFELLLLVSGVGPKTALSVMRRAPREALIGAVGKRDIEYLTRVVGLGKKMAEKLAVELSEKMGGGESHDEGDADVFDMLVALGYTEREARKALAGVSRDIVGKDARFKAALSGKK